MQASISHIHISLDMWTSPNYLAMLSIFAHYLDKDGVRQSRLIAFKRVLGARGETSCYHRCHSARVRHRRQDPLFRERQRQ